MKATRRVSKRLGVEGDPGSGVSVIAMYSSPSLVSSKLQLSVKTGLNIVVARLKIERGGSVANSLKEMPPPRRLVGLAAQEAVCIGDPPAWKENL